MARLVHASLVHVRLIKLEFISHLTSCQPCLPCEQDFVRVLWVTTKGQDLNKIYMAWKIFNDNLWKKRKDI